MVLLLCEVSDIMYMYRKSQSTDEAYILGDTAGNLIALRLTEDPKVSVLLIEAGIS